MQFHLLRHVVHPVVLDDVVQVGVVRVVQLGERHMHTAPSRAAELKERVERPEGEEEPEEADRDLPHGRRRRAMCSAVGSRVCACVCVCVSKEGVCVSQGNAG